MRLKYLVLCLFVLIFFCTSSSQAERFFIAPGGLTVPVDDDGKNSKVLTFKEKMARDAAAAAAKGYKVGQVVKEENGFIYKLAKDSKTGGYTFKLFRKVNKKTPKATPRVSKEDMDRMARIEREKREKLRALTLKREKEERKLKEKERLRKEKERKERQRKEKERKERQRKERERKERIAAEDRVIRDAEIAAELREAERLTLKKQRHKKKQSHKYNDDSQRLKRGDWVVGMEHRYLKWKTVLTKRTETTASGTQNIPDGVGEEDMYYTKAHGDLLLLRVMPTRNLEIFLEAGMAYESFSDIMDMESTYGGGFRYVVKETEFLFDAGVYLDFTARYMVGKITGTYTDTGGIEFVRSSEFREIEAGLEAGLRLYRLTLYGGVTYGMFSEETIRGQALPAPAIRILDDDLEEQDSLGTMLGLNFRMTPHWTVYAQWHSGFKEGAMAGMQYRF